jgi:predicted nucleic acid-binding protein
MGRWGRAGDGAGRSFTVVAALVDTNVLVYRFDPRFPERQAIATEILRKGIAEDSVRVPHQAIVEFVAVVTRPIGDAGTLLSMPEAIHEAEEMLAQFTILYPDEALVRTALRGAVAYQLAWFDAHLWAYAEHFGLSELLSEHFQHDRLYGSVRAVNPFV